MYNNNESKQHIFKIVIDWIRYHINNDKNSYDYTQFKIEFVLVLTFDVNNNILMGYGDVININSTTRLYVGHAQIITPHGIMFLQTSYMSNWLDLKL